MDTRDLIILLIGFIIGAGVGYAGFGMIKPYVEPYMFESSLTLTTETTTVLQNSTVNFYVSLNISLPPEIASFEEQIKPNPVILIITISSTLLSLVNGFNLMKLRDKVRTFIKTKIINWLQNV